MGAGNTYLFICELKQSKIAKHRVAKDGDESVCMAFPIGANSWGLGGWSHLSAMLRVG